MGRAMMRQCYICGPYTASTPEANLKNIGQALSHALALTRLGWNCIVPHAMGSHHATWDAAMARCRDLIRGLDPKTDALVLLPNWRTSQGAQEEVELARSLGIPVLDFYEATVEIRKARVA
jgi:hypothetical protein